MDGIRISPVLRKIVADDRLSTAVDGTLGSDESMSIFLLLEDVLMLDFSPLISPDDSRTPDSPVDSF